MPSITLSIPEDIKHVMEKYPEINWSGFVRKAIEQKVRELSWREEMLCKLEQQRGLTEWSVKAQRSSRKGRFAFLKKKGLLP